MYFEAWLIIGLHLMTMEWLEKKMISVAECPCKSPGVNLLGNLRPKALNGRLLREYPKILTVLRRIWIDKPNDHSHMNCKGLEVEYRNVEASVGIGSAWIKFYQIRLLDYYPQAFMLLLLTFFKCLHISEFSLKMNHK